MDEATVIRGVQRVQAPWYSHSGNETIKATIPSAIKNASVSFSRQQSMLEGILANQKAIMDHHGIGGYNPGTWQV